MPDYLYDCLPYVLAAVFIALVLIPALMFWLGCRVGAKTAIRAAKQITMIVKGEDPFEKPPNTDWEQDTTL